MKLLITGATGYIGERLTSLSLNDGYEVISATRKPCRPDCTWLAYDLRGPVPKCPEGTTALIHLAADTSKSAHTNEQEEVRAARELILRARQVAAKLIFISSQTAAPSAPSAYGRTKWLIEQEVLAADGVVIRPGQVYGGPERGLFGMLSGLVRRVPIIPILLPAPQVQPIHIDDLAKAILTIVRREDIRAETLSLGSVRPISFGHFLMSIAENRVNVVRAPMPLPVALLKLLGLLLGKSMSARLGLDRIFSLINLPTMETERSLQRLGIELRSLAHGMHRSGRGQRRQLLREGVVLLSYLLKSPPQKSLVRRYVRALEHTGRTLHVTRSRMLSRWPALLTVLDNASVFKLPNGRELSWRLQAAISIAEASPQGAKVFLGLKHEASFLGTLLALGLTSINELTWRVFAFLCKPVRHLLLESEIKREA
ncbi:hypothetical protein PS938_00607 [Pseudomonas fluorescens]|uniref:NAD-dependent epimerase/dehydratase domain-containing protein n=1 Tax=Pseudomonas fluorescens TaxID=294 RepID=A0A5E7S2S8_PSEFL|nr:NAD-dependent epimerase/dehydratase family protein [Pseudomonas fluorescens]VVP80208.1 hypothetical protein PS938_00607 [Pseudomonas fluorescens]